MEAEKTGQSYTEMVAAKRERNQSKMKELGLISVIEEIKAKKEAESAIRKRKREKSKRARELVRSERAKRAVLVL